MDECSKRNEAISFFLHVLCRNTSLLCKVYFIPVIGSAPGQHHLLASGNTKQSVAVFYYTGMEGAASSCGWMCVLCCRYDIKGCEVSRWTEPAPEGSQIIVVLKDLNFEGQSVILGKEK